MNLLSASSIEFNHPATPVDTATISSSIAPAAPVNEIPSAIVRVVHPRKVTAAVNDSQSCEPSDSYCSYSSSK